MFRLFNWCGIDEKLNLFKNITHEIKIINKYLINNCFFESNAS